MMLQHACFLQFLRDYVHGCPSSLPPEQVDWMQIARDAEEQSLGGIIYVQCRKLLPTHSEALKRLHQGFYSAVYTYFNSKTALMQVGEKLKKAHVAYLPFKGEIIRCYYPNPELRIMGDLDILIHHRDREKVDGIMRRLGYNKFVDNHAVWTYLKPNLMFEIHNEIFYEYLCNSVDYKEYFRYIWDTAVRVDDTCRYEPEPNRHFLYLICHMAKHIINKGIGFRAFLDITFMTLNEEKLDWKWITDELEKIELLGFAKMCFAFCQRWFGVTMPLEPEQLDENFFEEVTAKTFNDGTFGLHNDQNEGAHSAKEHRHLGMPYWKTMLFLTWKKMFPPYKDMQLIPWYSFVDGKPWLMPVAWIYRWIYTGVHKFESSRDLLMEPFVKRDIIEKRERYLKAWKL